MPKDFDAKSYATRPWKITKYIHDGEKIDLGGRTIEVIAHAGSLRRRLRRQHPVRRARPRRARPQRRRQAAPGAARPVRRHSSAPLFGLVKDRSFAPLLLAAAGLSLASVSDALIYVGLQRTIDFEPAVFPLLYVITAVAFMALAIPVGQLADRIGRVPVLLAGYALLFVVYGALLMSSLGYVAADPLPARLGGYFAATEGVMTALAGAVLPEKLQASGIGILITVVSLGRLRLLGRLRRALVRDRPAAAR